MIKKIALTILVGTCVAVTASADDLTMMVEKNLAALGYDTGPVDGEESMETVIAISKYQSENDLPVTGEVSAQLAETLSSGAPNAAQAAAVIAPASAAVAPAATDEEAALQAAQQACLERKIEKAQKNAATKRGLGRLVSAITRNTSSGASQEITAKAGDIYNANATADDLAAAAKDLGLSKKDVNKCQNPGENK